MTISEIAMAMDKAKTLYEEGRHSRSGPAESFCVAKQGLETGFPTQKGFG